MRKMLKIFFLLISPLLTPPATILATAHYQQSTTLYSERDGGGGHISFVQSYVQDLSRLHFDNRAQSVCVMGIYLFYDLPNYNRQDAGMEYVFGRNLCVNFKNLAGQVSSLRFVGSSSDYRQRSLTLFEGHYFQGEEERLFNGQAILRRLDLKASSLILTGDSPWTLYDETFFKGNSVCVHPPTSNDYTPLFLFDTTTIQVPHGTIRSVRMGCHGGAQRQVFPDKMLLPNDGGLIINLAEKNDDDAANHHKIK